ncbi:hypothetical protein HMPREF1868_00404 [Olsenella sp. DNF00959]|nr:hypothetical protein HMPREF1868_00404 [Olsenella sp. DNF00959]
MLGRVPLSCVPPSWEASASGRIPSDDRRTPGAGGRHRSR